MNKIKNETKIITQHWGKINPRKIGDYLEVGGYGALQKFISKMTPEEAIQEVKEAGLCGRGGAGFSTGEKLEMVRKNTAKEKYFICNLDESEPGTWKDRTLAEKNPHLLLEGIIIGAFAVGAKKAYIYLNGSFEKAQELLDYAIREAEKKKLLGENILGSQYSLEVEIFSGAGAYICGEETALINSLEGNRGEPKARPPYPTERGLLGQPTVVNNAETLANIPWIISNGGKIYSKIGSSTSPGTKLFSVSGAVKNPGIFEAPMGTTLQEIIEDYAGGIREGKEVWFAQLGGASGRLILPEEFSVKLEYSKEAEFSLGAGGILVVEKGADIREILLSLSDFFRFESCGKCVPCREGTFRLWEIMKRFQDGEISDADRIAIDDILWTLENTCFCPLGKFAGIAIRDAKEKLKAFNSHD